ncbi:catalase-like [Brevipalpus obovatus]|uniref:catalase-like n=1 Tax=Brevipalpus obovatus TaxID=246614 RepID=UPI003D9E9E49
MINIIRCLAATLWALVMIHSMGISSSKPNSGSNSLLKSISLGPRGPIILPDNRLLEKFEHFSRERVPERINSALGNGALGYFECKNFNLSQITQATVFAEFGKKTDVIVRFTSSGRPGGSDLSRGLRAIGIKFYTDKGNWDLTGLDSPMFPIHDSLRFGDVTRIREAWLAQLIDYSKSIPQATIFPMMVDTDEATTDGWRRMKGFSVNTYKFRNFRGDYTYVRFKLEPQLKFQFLQGKELIFIRGNIPDYYQRDLYTAIARGEYPRWMLKAQLVNSKEARRAEFNIFDASREWDEKMVQTILLGEIVLNKRINNYHSQIEQLSFNPSNIIPGIEFAPDKVLQGRIFAYRDAQNARLGVNHENLPVNRQRNKEYLLTPHNGACFGPKSNEFYPIYGINEFELDLKPTYPTHKSKVIRRRTDWEHETDYTQLKSLWNSQDEREQLRSVKIFAGDSLAVDSLAVDEYVNNTEKIDEDYFCKLSSAITERRSSQGVFL